MRLKDWPSRLQAVFSAARARPFAWGEHDCCLQAAAAVQACTGVDLAAPWRGTYSTAAEAARLLQSLGGLRALAARAGPEIDPAFATAGDVGLVVGEDGAELLAVHSGQVWAAVSANGLEVVREPSRIVSAWKVGG